MAFVCRTTRDGNPIGNPFSGPKTLRHVGPGTYHVDSSFGKAAPSYAPFTSSAARSGMVSASFNPGPGQYSVPPAVGAPLKPHMETPFNSFAERFRHQKPTAAPGPGSYELPSSLKIRQKARVSGSRSGGQSAPGPVAWTRAPTAPSIPGPAHSYGYEEGETGQLVRQPPPKSGYTGKGADSAGPGAYNPNDRVVAGRTSVAVDFGRARAGRTDFTRGSAGPDPGQYQQDIAPSLSPRPVRQRPSAAFASRASRSGLGSAKDAADAPGPGAYATHQYTAFRKKVVPTENQYFGSTSRRFTSGSGRFTSNPGPGAYDNVVGAIRKPRTAPTRRRHAAGPAGSSDPPAAFSTTASRFQRKGVSGGAGPSPGDYNLPTMAADLMRKRDASRGGGVFGSTTKRFVSPEEAAKGIVPGPGQYGIPTPTGATARAHASSMFASTNERFKKKAPADGEVPAPGAYSPRVSWQTPSFARRSDGTQGLLSSGPTRFGKKDGAAEDLPGPGSYAVPGHAPSGLGSMVPSAPRFRTSAPLPTPGPGSYNAVPVDGGLHKRTFNMTIAEEEQAAEGTAVYM